MSAYIAQIITLLCIYAILAATLNIAAGYAGLINLGHIAFFGIGAYTSAILTRYYHVGFLPAFIAAGAVAALFGFLITVFTHKLKGDYFALATLAFNFIVVAVLLNWISFTRGPLGIPGIPRPVLFGFRIASPEAYAVFTLIVTAGIFYFLQRVTRSRYGTVLAAMRDDSIGVQALGKNIFRLRCQCIVLTTLCAGLAGSLFAHDLQFIDPYSFYIPDLIIVLTAAIVGGLASLPGSLIGAIIVLVIPEAIRFLPIPGSMLGALRQMIYSTILVVILLIRPRGILGKVDLE